MIAQFIPGVPAPQGSKRHVGNGVMVESSKKVGPWRKAVKLAFDGYGDIPLRGPLEVDAVFHLPRPKSNKSKHPVNPPDLDKLERGLWDALTLAGVWEDDAQVVLSHARKRWSQTPGAHVFIIPLDDHKEELDITPQPVLA